MNSTAARSHPRILCVWPAVVLLLAIFAAWSCGLNAPFLLDDQESIVTNATLRQPPSLAWLQPPATGGETVSGRPLLNLTFALDYALHGLDPRGFRATNLLVHAAAALLLFGIVRRTAMRLDGSTPAATWLAFLFAALWALHPLQTAAVTYIVQRAEALAGLFVLLSLYGFIRATTSEPPLARWFFVAVAAGWLGVFTKEPAAVHVRAG